MMPRTFYSLRLAVVVTFGAVACSGGDNGSSNAPMKATVNGAPFEPTETEARYSVDGDLYLIGTLTVGDTVKHLSVVLSGTPATGTYQLDAQQPYNLGEYTEVAGGPVKGWSSAVIGGTGTAVITQVTATHVSGTFRFTAPAVAINGATGTTTVTNGVFSLDIE